MKANGPGYMRIPSQSGPWPGRTDFQVTDLHAAEAEPKGLSEAELSSLLLYHRKAFATTVFYM